MRPVDDPRCELRSPQRLAVGGQQLAIRRDVIADRRVAVGSPEGSGFRSNDVLAFVRWTLPSLVQIFPQFPQRLLIVSGPDRHVARRSVRLRFHLSARGSAADQSERHQYAAARNGARGERIARQPAVRTGSSKESRSSTASTSCAARTRSAISVISELRHARQVERRQQMRRDGPIRGRPDRVRGRRDAALDREIRAATHDGKSLDDLARTLSEAHVPVTNAGFRKRRRD